MGANIDKIFKNLYGEMKNIRSRKHSAADTLIRYVPGGYLPLMKLRVTLNSVLAFQSGPSSDGLVSPKYLSAE